MPDQFVDSAGDERVANNVMRHGYRVLSEHEKACMQQLKDAGLEFIELLHECGGTGEAYAAAEESGESLEDFRQASRYLSLAQTAMEEAVMWAVKHVTR